MKELINLLKESIKLFYKNDSYLIEDNIHEQAISYRIAYYLENLMKLNNKYKNYNVDVEYNKIMESEKEIYNLCPSCNQNSCFIKTYDLLNDNKKARPNIIIHNRGNNANNLFVIEIKKETENSEDDNKKLCAYTCKKGQLKYKLGFYLNIGQNLSKMNYHYVVNGNVKNKKFKIVNRNIE